MDDNIDALMGIRAVAAEVFGTLDTGRQIEPFSSRISSFNLDYAYRVTAAVRQDARDPRRDASGTKDWIHQSDDLG
jgi:hypothetical protein